MKMFVVYVVLTILNVILQTVCHIGQVKWKKFPAAIMSAVAYGFYTIVIVYTLCDLPLIAKVLIVGFINFFCVLLVKFVEEKKRKDRLWRVEVTINSKNYTDFRKALINEKIPYSILDIKNNDYMMFILYCATQQESEKAHRIISKFSAKYFISETKIF